MNTMYILVEDRIFCITDQGDGTSALEIVEKDDPQFEQLLLLVQAEPTQPLNNET